MALTEGKREVRICIRLALLCTGCLSHFISLMLLAPGMPMKARVTNKSLYNLYDLVGANETSRTNANVSKVQTTSNYPAMNDEIVSGDSLNSANQILQLDPDFGCLPTLSKRKTISIRIPWNITPRDHTPSRRKAKSNNSPSNSKSSDADAQKR